MQDVNEITIVLPMPPSANDYWVPIKRGNFAAIGVSSAAKSYKLAASKIITNHRKDFEGTEFGITKPLDCLLKAEIALYPKNLRVDSHNYPKVLMDSIERTTDKKTGKVTNPGLILNDSQIIDTRVYIAGIAENGDGYLVLTLTKTQYPFERKTKKAKL